MDIFIKDEILLFLGKVRTSYSDDPQLRIGLLQIYIEHLQCARHCTKP